MKISVLSASPKGKYSVTFQSVRYLQKHFPQHEWETFHIGKKIIRLEKDPEALKVIAECVGKSDLVLWLYPVYTCLVPYQLMKFVSLIHDSGLSSFFEGKYCSQILTSKHFYDNTAYDYMQLEAESLGMKHLPGHCADMDDLTTEKGRDELLGLGNRLFSAVDSSQIVAPRFTLRSYKGTDRHSPKYQPSTLSESNNTSSVGEKVVIVTDCRDEDVNLRKMIDRFKAGVPGSREVNLNDFKFMGGCLGCFKCAFDGNCFYPDGFDSFHKGLMDSAQTLIYAGVIDRHWFRSVWKCYDDRQFYNGHRTSMMGCSIGYLVSGPLADEPQMRHVLEARSEVGHLFLLDIVSDEAKDSTVTDALIDQLAVGTLDAVVSKPSRPVSFSGVGGMKVFRDLIYVMRGLMQEDHRFYKKKGIYDFPHKQQGTILKMKLVGLMMKSPKMRAKGSRMMNDAIAKQYDKIIDKY